MNKLIFGLFGLFLIAIAGALVGPSFFDWNTQKGRLVAEVEALTGRSMTIEGDVRLALLPRPTFTAAEVRLANVPGGSADALLELEALRLRIAWLPLLQGRVRLDSLELVEPRLHLEILADGRRNWELQGLDRAGSEIAETPERVAIRSVVVRGGSVSFRDAASGSERRIEALNAEIAAAALNGPFEARGEAVVEGRRTVFEVDTAALRPDRAARAKVALELPELRGSAGFAGSLTPGESGTVLRGRVDARGEDLGAFLPLAGLEGLVTVGAGRPFAVKAAVEGDRTAASASEVDLTLGEARFSGQAQAAFGPSPEIGLTLRATRLDLNAFFADTGAGGEAGAEPSAGTETTAAPQAGAAEALSTGPGFWDRASAALDIAVDAADYRGQAVRDLRLEARLAGGVLEVGRAAALLPGRAALDFSGRATAAPTGPGLDGRITLRADNLRRLAAWLGYGFGGLPGDRLRRLALDGRLVAGPEKLELRDLEAELDRTKLTGGVIVALRDRPGLGIGLVVERVDLGRFLPAAPVSGAPASSDGDLRGVSELVDRFDANIDLRVGSLAFRGAELEGLRVDAMLREGSLTVREASATDFAGGRARVSGVVSGLTAKPKIDGDIAIEEGRPRALLRMLGMDPGPLPRLGRVSVTSGFLASESDVTFDAAATALGGTLELSGKALLDEGPAGLSARVALKHPDLASVFAASADGAAALPLELEARLSGTVMAPEAGEVTLALGKLVARGRVAADLSGPRPFVSADLAGEELSWRDLAPLSAVFAPPPGGDPSRPVRSRTARDPEPWRALDGDLALRLNGLLVDRVQIRDLALAAGLRDGVFEIQELSGRAYGGRLEATGRLAGSARLEGELALRAAAVELAPLVQDQFDLAGISGPVDLEAELQARGGSPAQLLASLSGQARLSGSLRLEAPEEGGGNGAAPVRRPEDLRSLADGLAFAAETFAAPPARLTGAIVFEKGIVTARSLELRGEAARLEVRASADLPQWTLDCVTELRRTGEQGPAYLALELSGDLDEPDLRLSGTAFRQGRGAAPAAAEADSDVPIKDLSN